MQTNSDAHTHTRFSTHTHSHTQNKSICLLPSLCRQKDRRKKDRFVKWFSLLFGNKKVPPKRNNTKRGAIKNKGTLVPVAPRLLSDMLMVKLPSKLCNNRQHGKAKTCFTGTFCLSFSAAQKTFFLGATQDKPTHRPPKQVTLRLWLVPFTVRVFKLTRLVKSSKSDCKC